MLVSFLVRLLSAYKLRFMDSAHGRRRWETVAAIYHGGLEVESSKVQGGRSTSRRAHRPVLKSALSFTAYGFDCLATMHRKPTRSTACTSRSRAITTSPKVSYSSCSGSECAFSSSPLALLALTIPQRQSGNSRLDERRRPRQRKRAQRLRIPREHLRRRAKVRCSRTCFVN